MMKNTVQALVLAAGRSRRFNTTRSKLLEPICGQAMILYPVKLLQNLGLKTSLIVGYQREQLLELLQQPAHHLAQAPVDWIVQTQQLGTGHALLCAQAQLTYDHILVLNGDVPLISAELLQRLYEQHLSQQAAISFVIAHNLDPELQTLGKVLTIDQQIKIIEAKDFAQQRAYYEQFVTADTCINAGIYLIKRDFLLATLTQLSASTASGELYITDLVNHASAQGLPVATVLENMDAVRGVNTLRELWIVEQIKRAEIINYWLSQGVRFQAPQTTHLDLAVTLAPDSVIGAGVEIYGASQIGQGVQLGAYCIVTDSQIAAHSVLPPFTYLKNSRVDQTVKLPPFTALIDQIPPLKKSKRIGKQPRLRKHQAVFTAAQKLDDSLQP